MIKDGIKHNNQSTKEQATPETSASLSAPDPGQARLRPRPARPQPGKPVARPLLLLCLPSGVRGGAGRTAAPSARVALPGPAPVTSPMQSPMTSSFSVLSAWFKQTRKASASKCAACTAIPAGFAPPTATVKAGGEADQRRARSSAWPGARRSSPAALPPRPALPGQRRLPVRPGGSARPSLG